MAGANSKDELHTYASRAARALVLLHEEHLRRCLTVWQQAKAAGVTLPEAGGPDYASLDALLHHILRSARLYMVRICQHLDLPDPEIAPPPDPERIESEAEPYLAHLLERWRLPLAPVTDEQMEPAEELYQAGMPYWIDAMLEHAVMHPIRHEFQLRELMARQTPNG
ncbi:hypothetical protein DKM44_08480 [Deinococcus irradiatisoli]|uniref:DinB family protein n=1 Tax=Deinococcus irradiatisoli TaxID=2202254 RepID=A0A2Z3JDL0_9DEIO|nr:hypothetical protein [Deinococcus irradiatisoli]AWN23257.1 hypothetical protein DKM44_08480 [Deinococcus irradiatisoli]